MVKSLGCLWQKYCFPPRIPTLAFGFSANMVVYWKPESSSFHQSNILCYIVFPLMGINLIKINAQLKIKEEEYASSLPFKFKFSSHFNLLLWVDLQLEYIHRNTAVWHLDYCRWSSPWICCTCCPCYCRDQSPEYGQYAQLVARVETRLPQNLCPKTKYLIEIPLLSQYIWSLYIKWMNLSRQPIYIL